MLSIFAIKTGFPINFAYSTYNRTDAISKQHRYAIPLRNRIVTTRKWVELLFYLPKLRQQV